MVEAEAETSLAGAAKKKSTPAATDSKFKFVANDEHMALEVRRHAMREVWRQRKLQKKDVSAARKLEPKRSAVGAGGRGIGGGGGGAREGMMIPQADPAGLAATVAPGSASAPGPGPATMSSQIIAVTRPFGYVDSKTLASAAAAGSSAEASTPHPLPDHSSDLDGFVRAPHHQLQSQTQIIPGQVSFAVSWTTSGPVFAGPPASTSSPPDARSQSQSQSQSRSSTQSQASPDSQGYQSHLNLEPVDDGVFRILGQLSLEMFWGSEEVARSHQEALKNMIDTRENFSGQRLDWRLEQYIHVILQHIKPRWAVTPRVSHEATTTPHKLYNSCKRFVQFMYELRGLVEDMMIVDPSAISKYPSIEAAIRRLRDYTRFLPGHASPLAYTEESARFVALLYVSVRLANLLRDPFSSNAISDLQQLNFALEARSEQGSLSIEVIFAIVSQRDEPGPDNLERSLLVMELMDVARLFRYPSWLKVKQVLLELILLSGLSEQSEFVLCWDADMLFAEVSTGG